MCERERVCARAYERASECASEKEKEKVSVCAFCVCVLACMLSK